MTIDEIKIRSDLRPGDLGYVMYRHGKLYGEEYNFGVAFETYVGAGLFEFYSNYDPGLDRVWICEHRETMIGFVLLMHRENKAAQLRFFYLEAGYRGLGLGKRLMGLFMDFLKEKGYQSAYLWTTHELHTAASLYMRHGFKLTDSKESLAFGKPLKEQRYDLTVIQ